MNTLTEVMQLILVQQVSFVRQAQDRYEETGRSKDATRITELLTGLSILPDTLTAMNELGVSNIDVESIRLFLNKVELERNLNNDENTEDDQECQNLNTPLE